ncbi:MAG: complex I NDUFA9 subunit family protein [Pseudomonadota bacterium]|nr:complex I NDUFA9 subunit family protein [Pseudomonadota bacterium]
MAITSITVFGGTGFLGRHVVMNLARQGFQVKIACRKPNSALRCKPMGDVGQITAISTNIRFDASVDTAVEGSDAVVNLIGVLHSQGRQNFQSVHVEGAARIANAASLASVKRLIHISAIGADHNATSKYAQTKGLGESVVREAFPSATILRPSIVFGPDDNFFNKFAGLARLIPALPLIGGGSTKFQPVYVGDVAEAVSVCLGQSITSGNLYELGGPQTYSFRNLMEIMLTEILRHKFLVPIPFWFAKAMALFLEKMKIPLFLPEPLLTRDQVDLLRVDNVVGSRVLGLVDLKILPTALEAILPSYLQRYRRSVGTRQSTVQ